MPSLIVKGGADKLELNYDCVPTSENAYKYDNQHIELKKKKSHDNHSRHLK